MTFHSKSAVEFGQFLNTLTRSLTDGSPLPVALDAVREHFHAEAVMLRLSSRSKDCVLVADSDYEPLDDDNACHDKSVAAMIERYQHISASEYDASGTTDYCMWIFRDRENKRFDNEETALAGVLITQIARAIDLSARIDSGAMGKALYSSALDRLNVGVIVIDGLGRPVSTSPVADTLLADRDGIQIQAGRLRATNAAEDRDLQKAIRAVQQDEDGDDDASEASCGLPLTKRSGARTLGAIIRRVPGARAGDLTAIYLRDCDTVSEIESEFIRRIFDLTPAEAAVTNRLAAGDTLEDAATTLGISRNTARAHLRSIFSKSGITRQTELVRLVLSSAVVLGERPRQAA
ncbi:helix-turn-helix transcriptional regulator [Oricola sp.]|uniref:helix-turn-helix transcriptional regulator n=1 Tax=Oricola sp. TaxID=1979950 RepID=UPI0025F19F0F|nr:helix-turn-helix transcriptional regulator [Oricola sp.]MCI5074461.1 helix-turn-helix transcriptional regulator [Oricola sp.]